MGHQDYALDGPIKAAKYGQRFQEASGWAANSPTRATTNFSGPASWRSRIWPSRRVAVADRQAGCASLSTRSPASRRIKEERPSPCWLFAATLLKGESHIGEENVSLRLILSLWRQSPKKVVLLVALRRWRTTLWWRLSVRRSAAAAVCTGPQFWARWARFTALNRPKYGADARVAV